MFSVIIPLYNKELSIYNTIKSVLNQTFKDFEIIIVNDGSTDNSEEIVKNIKDNRIHLINQENQGVSFSRNEGIKRSKYNWIALLDADDIWKEDHLEEICKMMQYFQDYKVYVTSFSFSDERYIYRHKRESPIFKIEDYFQEAIRENLISSSNVVIHKDCFEKIGYFNLNLSRGEDLDLWARLAKKYTIIKSVKLTAIYRVDAENRTNISKDIERTHVYYFNLNENCSLTEKEYYKYVLLNRFHNYLRLCYFSSFMNLKKIFPEITFKEIFLFSIKKIKIKLSNTSKIEKKRKL